MELKITPSGQTIVKPTALGPVANTDTKLLIYGLFQKGRVLAQDGKRLRTLVKELSAAFALAVPRPETEAITPHLAFFQRVVAMIRKRLTGGGVGHARQRDIDAAVCQVIGGAIDADEVIDLFAVAGLSEARLDILSDEFLRRVAALEQKNLALETLRKLLNDQIRITERTNIVQSRKFREALEDAMLRYTNKAITTAEMISQLIDLAKSLRDAQQHGEELGLSDEETAFYDALAENGSAREAMQNDTLRLMARELTEMVKKMPKLDWTQRESVRVYCLDLTADHGNRLKEAILVIEQSAPLEASAWRRKLGATPRIKALVESPGTSST